jgi:hypothetical protein
MKMKKNILIFTMIMAMVFGTSAFAALTAVVTSTPTIAQINQPVNLNITVTNSTGSSALTLSNVQITASYNGNPLSRVPMALSVYPPSSVAIAAALTNAAVSTTFPMSVVFFAPSTGITGSGTGKYYVGALLYTSDGGVTSAATSAPVTVNPVPLPLSERQ